jgi:Domain of unknown function (DUF4365)
MARHRLPAERKIRTREHVIADLAVNAVERQVLLRGYTLDALIHDYGYDGALFVYNSQGEVESGQAFAQVKATEQAHRLQDGQTIAYRLDRADLQRWLTEPMPVILCLYEAASDRTFWLYVQHYFESLPEFNLFQMGDTVTVHIPGSRAWVPEAVGAVGDAVRRVVSQAGRVSHV